MTSTTVHVIPHTHWDYEWYFTQPESSVQLVYHMDDLFRAFRTGAIHHYVLDGQMSIVEDYLALAPEHKEELAHWVSQGNLVIGPWFTQCDQMIISGESIVRNLMLGLKSARTLGGGWLMGYVPDAFGQSIDMPKIYNGFGIHRTVFWRGLSTEQCHSREFIWRCEDGSQVQGYQLRNGYYLAEPQLVTQAPDTTVNLLSTGTISDQLPLPYGADQIKVNLHFKQQLSEYNQRSESGHHFVESTYDALFDHIDHTNIHLPDISGEMLDAQFSKIHRSIYSTRYDHKALNDQIETRLAFILEPLTVLASQYGFPPQQSMIQAIWKNLLRCHAHDSAGGCNSDRTNLQILQRLIQTDQMSSANVDYLVRKLAESLPSSHKHPLVLFNTLPFERCERTRISLETQAPYFSLFDEEGQPLQCTILQTKRCYRGTIRRDPAENDESLYYFHHDVELATILPSLGYRCFDVQESNIPSIHAKFTEQITSQTALTIRNQQAQVVFDQGQLSFQNQHTQTHWTDFLHIRDMGDDGDNYDYSAPVEDWIIQLGFEQAHIEVSKTAFRQTMSLSGDWLLPADLEARKAHQASVRQAYRLELALSDNEPLDIRLTIDNQVRDHRMQLVVNSDVLCTQSIADTPFGTVVRPHIHARMYDWRQHGWKEEPSCIYPFLHHVSLRQREKTLTLFSCGIKEYEVIQPESLIAPERHNLQTLQAEDGCSGQLALTLFRSVGWLGKPELQRRPGIASGQQFKYIPTPDSQMLQPLQFRIGLQMHRQFNPARLMKQWQCFAVPFLAYQKQELNRFTNTMKYFGINPAEITSINNQPLLELHTPELVVSALKMAETDEAGTVCADIIIRLYNPSSQPVPDAGMIKLNPAIQSVSETTLDERNIASHDSSSDGSALAPHTPGSYALGRFAPKQIRSFRLMRSSSSQAND